MADTLLLAIGAHPDDADFGCGGLLAKLAAAGQRVGIVDLTQGEMGSRGTPEVRAEEAANAAKILGLSFRKNLGLGDAQLFDNYCTRLVVAQAFRDFRPALVVCPYPRDRHPDHAAAGMIVKGASLLARLQKAPLQGEIHSITRVFHYYMHDELPPTFAVDITEFAETKLKAIEAHVSQFSAFKPPPNYQFLGTSDYRQRFLVRSQHTGSLIGVDFAEGFYLEGALRLDHPEEVLLHSTLGPTTYESGLALCA